MRKPDELLFLKLLLARCRRIGTRTGETPRQIINSADFPIAPKRAWYLLEKFSGGRDWYDFGVALDLGWLTKKGVAEITALLETVPGHKTPDPQPGNE
jgi:hypothetical protein